MSGEAWRFAIGGAVAPGQKTTGFVDWSDPVLMQGGVQWPYTAIHGARPGPAALVLAGVHGSEYPSIDAALRLAAETDPGEVRGQILCLPLLNPAAFWDRVAYMTPADGKNPNRCYPGKPDGTWSDRLAYHVTQRAIARADCVIDLHGGDLPEALVPFSIFIESGNAEVDRRSRALAEAFGLEGLMVHRADRTTIAGTTYAAAALNGVPAIIAEDGGVGYYDPAIGERMLRGLRNALRQAGVLAGDVEAMPPPRAYEGFTWLRAKQSGFFRPAVRVGDEVRAGQTLGTVSDLFGRALEEITTPDTGRVLFIVVSPAIAADGLICGVGVDPS
ncbi:MAG: succinylglutamate desuccinylase/aspartoacylase family protein [Acetobacteraceae bacterium]|nr:succinylglutamate desuccinylase/aspartoacylase family protein [Acetobacteraceae bacterium]